MRNTSFTEGGFLLTIIALGKIMKHFSGNGEVYIRVNAKLRMETESSEREK